MGEDILAGILLAMLLGDMGSIRSVSSSSRLHRGIMQ